MDSIYKVDQMARQNEKTVLITGAAQRLGAAMAKTFHKAGYRVIIHYFGSEAAALKLCAEFNQIRSESAVTCHGSLSQPETIANQVCEITDTLAVLINNASSFYPTSIGTITEQDWDNLFESNAKAPLFLTQSLVPLLIKHSTESPEHTSSVINLVDIHAQKPLKNHTVYSMAKAANQMLTMSLAKELAPNIRVNGIAPGAILWPDQEDEVNEEYKQETLNKIPAQTLGDPQHIADTALFLADGPGYITGQILSVDGGRTLFS